MVEEFDVNQLIEDDYQEFMDESGERDERSSAPEVKKVRKRGEGKVIELFPTVREPLLEFLLKNSDGKSRTTVKSFLANRQVTINGIIQKQFDFMLRPDDKVVINLGMAGNELRNPMLRIVYEDDYILIINKKYGLLSMATDTERTRTAYFILSEYLKKKDSSNRIFIVHRLDRETSASSDC